MATSREFAAAALFALFVDLLVIALATTSLVGLVLVSALYLLGRF